MSAGPLMTELAQIALDMPLRPTSADLLRALTRAERSGYERACRERGIASESAPAVLTLLEGV